MLSQLRPAFVLLVLFTLLTGVAYPLAITGVAQLTAPSSANGSVVEKDGKVVGSSLIGQRFASPRYFHGRPSAAGANGYDASGSGGSNLGPTSSMLVVRVARDAMKKKADDSIAGSIPADLVTASGSGLDPDITPRAAQLQVWRVALERGLPEPDVSALVGRFVKPRLFGLIGEPHVNVLALNMALDKLSKR